MKVRLSSKGQLVIPRAIRKQLDLRAGQPFDVSIEAGNIVLHPESRTSQVDALTALRTLKGFCAGGPGMLDALEADHRAEIERDETALRA